MKAAKTKNSRNMLKSILLSILLIGTSIGAIISVSLGYTSCSQTISSFGTIVQSSGLGYLHTNGKWIVDSNGNNVTLCGAGFMGYEFGAWDTHIEEDYATMASLGFNVVRLPIAWSFIEPQPGVYDDFYFSSYVDRDIAWAKEYGIYIILDMHQYDWSPYFSHGNGLPSWAVSAYPNNASGMSQAEADFLLGKGPNGTTASAGNPSLQSRLITVWEYVANRYANESTIAGYDLFNEPEAGTLSKSNAANYLYSFYINLISQIRTIDTNHILFYEPVGGYDTSTAQLINQPNVAFTLHFYDLNSNYSGNITDLLNDWNWKYNFVKNWNIPIWIGEFNADPTVQNGLQWINDTVSIFNSAQIGGAWWTYGKSDTDNVMLCYQNGSVRTEITQFLTSGYE
jgi:endoglycosylceramidase